MQIMCLYRSNILHQIKASDEDMDSIPHSCDLIPVCALVVKPLKSWLSKDVFICSHSEILCSYSAHAISEVSQCRKVKLSLPI